MEFTGGIFVLVIAAFALAQVGIYVYASHSEHRARKTYWSTPTVTQVQRRYTASRWSLIIFMVLTIVYILLFFPMPGA